jgi:hypothetical protein
MTTPTTRPHEFKAGDRVRVHRDGVFHYEGLIVMTRFERGDVYRIREFDHGTVCDSYGFELVLVPAPCTIQVHHGSDLWAACGRPSVQEWVADGHKSAFCDQHVDRYERAMGILGVQS